MNAKLIEKLNWWISIIAGVQGLLLFLPESFPVNLATVISAVFVYTGLFLTRWKQIVSETVDTTKSYWGLLGFAFVATVPGLLDLFNVINIPHEYGQWIRFVINALSMLINFRSAKMFPAK